MGTNSKFNAICRVIFNQKHNLNKKKNLGNPTPTFEFLFYLNILETCEPYLHSTFDKQENALITE